MVKHKIAIIIPVYKPKHHLEPWEFNSIKNTISVFKNNKIFFVGKRDLFEDYKNEFLNVDYLIFADKFFKSVYGYNELLLSTFFYQKFTEFEKLVIVQTDAWVFKDMLSDFYEYDYIGAPWRFPPIFLKNYNFSSRGLVGNGGFSMRRTSFCIQILNDKTKIFSFSEFSYNLRILLTHTFRKKNFFKKIFICFDLIYLFIFYNEFKYSLKFAHYINEDVFFGVIASSHGNYKLPSPEDAATFSVETIIPEGIEVQKVMGCHSFQRRAKNFWEVRIKYE